jgi:hypothetical protein
MKTKQSRREFLRLYATGALGAMVISKSNWKTIGKPVSELTIPDLKSFGVGLQL